MLFVFSCIARWIVSPFLRSSLPPTLPTYTPQDTHGGTFSSILLIFMPCKVAGLVFFVLILRLFVVSTTTTTTLVSLYPPHMQLYYLPHDTRLFTNYFTC